MEDILLKKMLTVMAPNRPQQSDQDFEELQPFTQYISCAY